MLNKKMMSVISLACLMTASSFQPVFAQEESSAGTITWFNTGWSSATFGLITTAPIINPAHCAATSAYEVTSADPGFNIYYAAVLTAYSTGSSVIVAVSNTICTNGAPTIIGISVSPS